MRTSPNKLDLLLLPFALCGFAVAQPVYNLLLLTPVFLVARQNTLLDVWALVLFLSILLPLLLIIPALLLKRHLPRLASAWCGLVCTLFIGLFIAQLLPETLGGNWQTHIPVSVLAGAIMSWLLLRGRWFVLGRVLAIPAAIFPLWFLLFSPVLDQVTNYAAATPRQETTVETLPDIVFVILDELPLATLLDGSRQVDSALFPGFARLQSISTWYPNTTSVSDSTGAALPAILTSRLPGKKGAGLTVARQPVNLFTMLRHHYEYNVAEAVTRFCPHSLCPRTGPGSLSRFKALLLDLTAIYLHRVVPDDWKAALPSVTNNWSGFFAKRQVFFPDGWLKHAGAQTEIDRPGYFEAFTRSIRKNEQPTLNFMHILFPHEPNAYLSDGSNYGLAWMRGQSQEQWGDVEWGVISGKQRHYLQVQYVDHLLNNLLDHLENEQILDEVMLVVLADHGISFELGDTRRALSDINHAALLRVPLFVKYPRQLSEQSVDYPAMTIDVVPTVVASLGFSTDRLEMDGTDLLSVATQDDRVRFANSHKSRELRRLDEAKLDLDDTVSINRAHLKLDTPGAELWEIGPYDQFRGQPMDEVCTQTRADIQVTYDKFKDLPNSDPAKALPAYVVGTFRGESVIEGSTPFLVTSNGIVVASGYSWVMNKHPIFFTLVEPRFVDRSDWNPQAWMVVGTQCLGDSL